MVANPDINSLIWMLRHYEAEAKRCWDVYADIESAAYMFDYYMEMADLYKQAILSHI